MTRFAVQSFSQAPARHLEQREPTRDRQHFHAITVIRILFGSWVMVREWGRIGRQCC